MSSIYGGITYKEVSTRVDLTALLIISLVTNQLAIVYLAQHYGNFDVMCNQVDQEISKCKCRQVEQAYQYAAYHWIRSDLSRI